MKALLALATVLLLALPALAGGNLGAPPFPFRAYPEARSVTPACEGQAVLAIFSEDWRALSNETRDVFVHLTHGEVDYVYLTIGDAGSGPVVQRVLTRAEAKQLYPEPCTYLSEISA